MQAKTITSCVRVDLVRPLGANWDDVNPQMYALSDAGSRAMNEAILSMLVLARSQCPHEFPKVDRAEGAHVGRQKGAALTVCKICGAPSMRTECYRAISEAIEKDRTYWAAQATSPEAKSNARLLAKARHREALYVPSTVLLAWSGLAYTQMGKWLKNRHDMRVPSFRRGAPIAVSGTGWSIKKDGKGYVLRVQLAGSPRHPSTIEFALGVDGGSAHAMLRQICEAGEGVKPGDCKIVREERRSPGDGITRSVWAARLSVTRPATKATLDPEKKLAVHRGIRTFLTAADTSGWTDAIDDGSQLLAFKAQMMRRRHDWYGYKKHPGKRAKGRGWWRRYEMYRKLEETEENFTQSFIRERAAWIVAKATQRGCGTIVLEDYSAKELADGAGSERVERLIRRFPLAALREAIVWSAKKAGLSVDVVASEWESCTCPKCGNVDAGQDSGRGNFTCTASGCGLRRSVDAVACWNMLLRAGTGTTPAPGLAEHEASVARFVGDARERRGGAKKSVGTRGVQNRIG